MSIISYRPRGGQNGIEVTTKELEIFSGKIGSQYLDEVIPLPATTIEEQKKKLKDCSCTIENSLYWKTDNGSHGWCCEKCGAVTQWG